MSIDAQRAHIVAQFFGSLYRTVRVHQMYKDSTPEIVRIGGPDCNVRRTIIIKVTYSGDRGPIAATTVVFYMFFDATIRVQEQHVRGVSACAHRNVRVAVMVQVPYAGN